MRRKVLLMIADVLVLLFGVYGILSGVFAQAGFFTMLPSVLLTITALLTGLFLIFRKDPSDSNKVDFKDFLMRGGLIGILFGFNALHMLAGAFRDRTLLGGALILVIATFLILRQGLTAPGRQRHAQHRAETLAAWERLDQMGQEADGRRILACPRCGELVYEDQDICDQCGNIFLANFDEVDAARKK